MIKLQNVSTPILTKAEDFKSHIASLLKIGEEKIKSVKLYKRSIDARRKSDLCFCDAFLIDFFDTKVQLGILKKFKNASAFSEAPYNWKTANLLPKVPPVIIGSGPAGLFAALAFCKAGVPPIIIERGQSVDKRTKSVEAFWQGEKLNANSNVQFGEGGAGTFSVGKLNTGIKDPRCRTVLKTFLKFGANEDILIKAKPHIGTDVLRNVVKNIRKEIESLGGKYLFETEFLNPVVSNGKLSKIVLKNASGEFEMPCEHLVLAIGNAARDTYKALWQNNVFMTPKPFSVGVRIEHLQEKINLSQYGEGYPKSLPAAEYKLATHLKNGRGVYTFCMCPGGVVVNSASEENTYVTNGMSYQSRSGVNANSALLVGVTEDDFSHLSNGTPFGAMYLQQQIEKAAFTATNGKGLPYQTVGNFLNKTKSSIINEVKPTALPSVCEACFDDIFPKYVTDSLKEALYVFDKKIKGFACDDAILTAPETRSSSPVRIVRNEEFMSNIVGIYPCGEGAGYAGGITSSAVDGMRCAEAIIESKMR